MRVVTTALPPVGTRIRQARLARGTSLRALAREIGVSASLVSQIENGKSQPSVSTLYAITTALGISVEALFDAGESAIGAPAVAAAPGTVLHALAAFAADPGRRIGPLVTPDEREVLELDSGVVWERLGHVPGTRVDFLLVTYRPGGPPPARAASMRHAGTEYGYLTSGELILTLGFDEYTLRPGDAVCFESTTPHRYRNDGEVPAIGTWFVSTRHCSVTLDTRRWTVVHSEVLRRWSPWRSARSAPNAVDWEQRVDLDRLREERLARLRDDAGALRARRAAHVRLRQHPLHDRHAHRHLGDGQADPLRAAAARRRADPLGLRLGRPPPPALQPVARRRRTGPAPASPRCAARSTPTPASPRRSPARSPHELREHGLAGEPVGVDLIEMPVLAALQAEGLEVVDGQQVFLEARRIKTPDEIALLTQACSMVDAAYEELYEFLRPGVRENECVGLVSKVLYDLGSEYVEGVNAISGERCSPHPHVYSDRLIRPGDPAFFDILHSHLGYRTCYYRCFAVGSASPAQRDAYVRCREYMDQAIALVKPGATTADIVAVWPRARGVRLRRRGGGVRPAVRARRRAVHLGEAHLQPAGLARPPRGARGGHGLRAGDLLAGRRRLVGRAHRGGGRGHRRRLRGHHQVPGRGAAGRRAAATGRSAAR